MGFDSIKSVKREYFQYHLNNRDPNYNFADVVTNTIGIILI